MTWKFKFKIEWKSHLIIVTQFFPPTDSPVGEDDDVPVGELHGLCDAVRFAAVVDVARYAARHRSVHHAVIVKAEHVDASVLALVSLLP